MGCCEARTQYENEPLERMPIFQEEEKFDFCMNYEAILSDIRAKEIETYASQLLNSPAWTTQIENQDFSIKTKIGSMFNEVSPVCLTILDLYLSIPSHIILNLLFYPETRMEWDPTLEFMEILDRKSNTLRIVKKYPFKPQEQIIKLSCVKDSEMTIVLYYSQDFAVFDENVQRSQCYFGMIKVIRSKNSTAVMLIQQEDYEKGTIADQAGFLASELTQWMQVLKKNIYKSTERKSNSY